MAQWMTVGQTAEWLACSPESVRRYFDAGRLNGWRTGDKVGRPGTGARRVYRDEKARALRGELDKIRRAAQDSP